MLVFKVTELADTKDGVGTAFSREADDGAFVGTLGESVKFEDDDAVALLVVDALPATTVAAMAATAASFDAACTSV